MKTYHFIKALAFLKLLAVEFSTIHQRGQDLKVMIAF